VFCNPGVDGAHEKGGIEGEGGYFRRNHWVPVPQALDLEDLNAQLLAACVADEQRRIAGREITVGQAVLAEKEHLLPLAEDGFDLAEVSFPRVDGMGRVQIRTNFYSVPVRAGLEVQARVYAGSVEIWHEGKCVARHQRSYGRYQEILDLELSVAKSLLPGIRALGIDELPKTGSAEERGKPLGKQVCVQHRTLIPASLKGFSSTKRLL